VFNGVSQVLDHILVSPKVGGQTYQVVHVNPEYHDQVSDHDPQVVVDITP
jgi:predicted extracellular nuclease